MNRALNILSIQAREQGDHWTVAVIALSRGEATDAHRLYLRECGGMTRKEAREIVARLLEQGL